jgi:hypothetical protein
MAGDGAARLLRQYAACPEGGWRDIPGVLRIGWRCLSAGESPHRSRIYRFPSEGRQEAGDDTALCRDDLARAYRRPSTQSLLKRSRAIGIEENGTRNVRGHGIAMKSMWDIGADLRAGRLKIVLPEWRSADAPVHALYHRNRYMATRVRALLDFLIERFAEESNNLDEF